MKSKKAQGISLETVITAAIVLIVLIVLWAIFTGRLELFSKELPGNTQECTALCVSQGHDKGDLTTPAVQDPKCNSPATSAKVYGTGNKKQACCCTPKTP